VKKTSGKSKAFHAKAQSRKGRKENKTVIHFQALRLCVRLFILSQLLAPWDTSFRP
jgi:hypothetical protein